MAENILVDGKPLHLLRVVDLREELKKRNIKTTGTKAQLQELLVKAITHEQELAKGSSAVSDAPDVPEIASVPAVPEVPRVLEVALAPDNIVNKDPPPEEDNNSSGSTDDNDSAVNSDSESKVESVPINEQHEKPSSDNVVDKDSPSKEENISNVVNKSSPSNEDNNSSGPTDDNTSTENSDSESKTASMPINKQNETIKLTESAKNDSVESKSSKPSIRGRLLSHSKSINEEDSSKPVQKKRRWGSSQVSGESTIAKKGISSDELKQLINESVTENDTSAAKVSKVAADTEEESVTVASTNDLTNNNNNNEKTESKEVEVKNVDGAQATNTINSESDANRAPPSPPKVEKPDDLKAERTVAPSKNPESTVLFVSGLVRPYTLPQLKKLLCGNGPIIEEKFWIDKIKSKCYAVYSTTEEAVKTREALHGLKWPQSSPKDLCVDFATLEDIDRCLNPENYENLPPPRKASPPAAKQQAKQSTTNEKSKRDTVIEINKGKYDIIQNEPIHNGKDGSAKNSTQDDSSSRNVREWDRKKVTLSERKENNDEQESRKRPRHSTENDPNAPAEKKEKIRSRTPEKKKNESVRDAKKSESPAKMLEDLFRKTKATPYIYWLPLSYEQAAEKAKKREILEKERLERVSRREADSKRENNFPPPPPPPANRSAPVNQDIHRDRSKMQNQNRRRSPFSPSRRKRSLSSSPLRNNARYSRSRSPDRRRAVSPRRRR